MPSPSYTSGVTRDEFGSGSLHMSPEEIDQYLTAEHPSGQSRLWVPPRITERTHSAVAANVSRGAPVVVHHPQAAASSAPSTRAPHHHQQIHPVELTHPGNVARLDAEEVHQGYGTTGGPDVSDDMVRLLRSHQKVSRVAIPVALIFGSAFVVALCYNNPPKSRGGMQQLATMDMPSGFACTNFLCPNSGTCAIKASDCPEGNPFLKGSGEYYALIQCGPSTLCNCKSKDSLLKCKGDQVMIHSWSSKLTGGCGHILCPRSGECVTNPGACTEGDPFANKHGPYYTEAMVASAVLSERSALKAAKDAKKATETLKEKTAEADKAKQAAFEGEAKVKADEEEANSIKAVAKPASLADTTVAKGTVEKADTVAVPV